MFGHDRASRIKSGVPPSRAGNISYTLREERSVVPVTHALEKDIVRIMRGCQRTAFTESEKIKHPPTEQSKRLFFVRQRYQTCSEYTSCADGTRSWQQSRVTMTHSRGLSLAPASNDQQSLSPSVLRVSKLAMTNVARVCTMPAVPHASSSTAPLPAGANQQLRPSNLTPPLPRSCATAVAQVHVPARTVIIGIGAVPNSELFRGKLEMSKVCRGRACIRTYRIMLRRVLSCDWSPPTHPGGLAV